MTDIKIIQGEFFTPDVWAKKSHEYIAGELGVDWKDKYVVWDCAAGQGALVKDLKFKNVFQSTINDHDVEFLEEHFPESTNFKFDFLNDDESQLPAELLQALTNNVPLLFYINPPFGKTYTSAEQHLSNREYFPATNIFYDRLQKEKMGKTPSSQLYIQFIYRIILFKEKYNLTNMKLALFAPPFFLTGGTFAKFRKIFFRHFSFAKGFLMDAKHFESVSSWRLSFTVFDGQRDFSSKNEFKYDIFDLGERPFFITNKRIYNLDNEEQALKWIKKDQPKGTLDCPQISNPLKFKESGRGYMVPDALGFFYNDTNYIKTNVQGVAIFSTGFYKGLGAPITKTNLDKVVALFAARRCFLKPEWYEVHDEYLVPNVDQESSYKYWNRKCLVYALFNNKSFQTSLRDIDYKEKRWDIRNHFFWLSKEFIRDLAEKHDNKKILQDLECAENTYIHDYLDSMTWGEHSSAHQVLMSIKHLFEISFSSREQFDEKYQLNTWDAGYAQLKWLWKKEFKAEYKEFKRLYKKLEEDIAKDIYNWGFLKK